MNRLINNRSASRRAVDWNSKSNTQKYIKHILAGAANPITIALSYRSDFHNNKLKNVLKITFSPPHERILPWLVYSGACKMPHATPNQLVPRPSCSPPNTLRYRHHFRRQSNNAHRRHFSPSKQKPIQIMRSISLRLSSKRRSEALGLANGIKWMENFCNKRSTAFGLTKHEYKLIMKENWDE